MSSLTVGTKEWKDFLHTVLGVPYKFMDYLSSGFHFEFEKADIHNNKTWFERNYNKHKDFMEYHSDATYPSFEWKNYKNWKASKNS